MNPRTHDQVIAALADPRRRRVCTYVAAADDPVVALEELVQFVADGAPGPPATGDASCSRIATRLHHVHLPLLDDAAIVDYDAGERSVGTGSAFPVAIELLEELADAPGTALENATTEQ